MVKIYELIPTDGRKSFYGKALVQIDDKGNEILYSYLTPIIVKTKDGDLIPLYDDWTQTTGRHIKSFCGLDKKSYMNLLRNTKVDFDIQSSELLVKVNKKY